MEVLVYLVFILATAVLSYWFFRVRRLSFSSRASLPIYVIIYDGRSAVLHRATRTQSGSFSVDGAEYPPSLAVRVDDAVDFPGSVYTIAIDSVALVQHRELERVRFGILTGALFKPAGDMVEMLRIVAAVAVIAVAVFVYMEVSSIKSALATQEAQLQQANEVLSKPLVVQGLPRPEVP